jgi:hypothetical protein
MSAFFRFTRSWLTPPIPSSEPTTLFAGDTAKWTRTFGDYASTDGWVLSYAFRGPSTFAPPTVTTSGNGFLVAVNASDSALLQPGTYGWAARVTKGGETYTVDRGVMTVALVASGVVVSHEEKVLSAINGVIEGRVTADMNQYAIGGRQVTKMTPAELLRFKHIYERKVWHLQNPGKIGVPVVVSFLPTDGNVGSAEPVSLPPWYRYGG